MYQQQQQLNLQQEIKYKVKKKKQEHLRLQQTFQNQGQQILNLCQTFQNQAMYPVRKQDEQEVDRKIEMRYTSVLIVSKYERYELLVCSLFDRERQQKYLLQVQ